MRQHIVDGLFTIDSPLVIAFPPVPHSTPCFTAVRCKLARKKWNDKRPPMKKELSTNNAVAIGSADVPEKTLLLLLLLLLMVSCYAGKKRQKELKT